MGTLEVDPRHSGFHSLRLRPRGPASTSVYKRSGRYSAQTRACSRLARDVPRKGDENSIAADRVLSCASRRCPRGRMARSPGARADRGRSRDRDDPVAGQLHAGVARRHPRVQDCRRGQGLGLRGLYRRRDRRSHPHGLRASGQRRGRDDAGARRSEDSAHLQTRARGCRSALRPDRFLREGSLPDRGSDGVLRFRNSNLDAHGGNAVALARGGRGSRRPFDPDRDQAVDRGAFRPDSDRLGLPGTFSESEAAHPVSPASL